MVSEPQPLDAFGFPNYVIYRDGKVISNLTRGRRKGSSDVKSVDRTGCVLLQDSFNNYKRVSVKVLAFKVFVVPELLNRGFVPIYDGYYINQSGEVYSELRAGKLIWQPNKEYWSVSLHCKSYLVHRLVAQTFIPNPMNYPEVDHIDGNKSNNHVSNLRWVDRSTNMKNAYTNGALDDSLSKAFAARGKSFVHNRS